MRWKAKEIKTPSEGDNRIVTRFAFLPVRLDGDIIVWLERYHERQIYRETKLSATGRLIFARWKTVGKNIFTPNLEY